MNIIAKEPMKMMHFTYAPYTPECPTNGYTSKELYPVQMGKEPAAYEVNVHQPCGQRNV